MTKLNCTNSLNEDDLQWKMTSILQNLSGNVDQVTLGRTKKSFFFLCSPPRILEHFQKKNKENKLGLSFAKLRRS